MELQTKEIDNHSCVVTRVFLFTTPVVAIALTAYYLATQPFSPTIWIFGVIYYYMSGMSITGGYHRLFSHRAYDASTPMKVYYALFGAAAFQHSILKWSLDHRLHHRFVDTDADPYSIKKGFWFAHIGWMLNPQEYPANAEAYVRDLEKDKVVYYQHKYYLPISIFMAFFFPMLIGWTMGSALGGLAVGGFLRLVVLHHATFFINSWCHMWGKKNFTKEHSAKDSHLMAFVTFGEGYHNFHHTFANDYRNGIRWYHWDPTKWSIRFASLIGMAKNLRVTSDEAILEKRLQMDVSTVKEYLSHSWEIHLDERISHLKQNVSIAQAKWMHLKAEYQAMKKSYSDASRARLKELKAEMRRARYEFKWHWEEWRAYHSHLLVLAPARI
jgi:stearoyl-CoA desaturase (delta-9 desaturase)